MPDTPDPQQARGLLLCDDLIFTSRITGTARALGLDVLPVRSADQLLQRAKESTPACVLLDLHNAGLKIDELVPALRENGRPAPFVVGYGSHVDTATLKAARAAGCDLVLPRSKFVEDLPTALPHWFAGRPGGA